MKISAEKIKVEFTRIKFLKDQLPDFNVKKQEIVYQQDDYKVSFCQTFGLRNQYYFYLDEDDELLISVTHSYTTDFNLVFILQIEELAEQFSFRFKTPSDVIKEIEQESYLPGTFCKSFNFEDSKQTDSTSFLKDFRQEQNYFHCFSKSKKPSDIWFVQRFMAPIQIEQSMVIRFQRSLSSTVDYQVSKLSPTYLIQNIKVTNISNNPDLHIENQRNLLHICDSQDFDLQDQKTCFVCLSPDDTQINGKNMNILVSPCKCRGTIKFLHIKCLLTIINMKNNRDAKLCSQCKRPYPQFLQIIREGKEQFISLFDNLRSPYMKLKRINSRQSEDRIQLYQSQEIYIGTHPGCKVSFQPQSDSQSQPQEQEEQEQKRKKYAKLSYDPKAEKVYLVDQKGKFPVLIKKEKNEIRLKKCNEIICFIMTQPFDFFKIRLQNSQSLN